MITVRKRIHSMERQAGWTAPYDDIAVLQAKPLRTFSSGETTKKKFGWQSYGNRDDW
jgi:hypothetical protein